MSIRKKVVLAFALFSVLVCSFYSLNASAIDISNSVRFVQGVARPYWQSSNNETKHQGAYTFGNAGQAPYTSTNWVRLFNASGGNLTVEGGNFVSIISTITAHSGSASQPPQGVFGIGSASSAEGVDCALIDYSQEFLEFNRTDFEYRYLVEWVCRATNGDITNPVTNLWANGSGSPGISINIQRVTVWEPIGDVDLSQVIARINAVNNNISTLNGKIDTTNSNLTTLIEKAEDLADAQQQLADQQQEQYENEKQEEAEREQQQQQQSSDAQGVFNFSVLNPFSGLFGLFNSSCSVNIPILASWIHSPTNVYTSWWCSDSNLSGIRNTLTPVFGIASMMLLFGFVVRWLSHNSGDIYGARNMNKGLNG